MVAPAWNLLANSDTMSLSPPPKQGKLKASGLGCLATSSAAGALPRNAADRALLPFCITPPVSPSPITALRARCNVLQHCSPAKPALT